MDDKIFDKIVELITDEEVRLSSVFLKCTFSLRKRGVDFPYDVPADMEQAFKERSGMTMQMYRKSFFNNASHCVKPDFEKAVHLLTTTNDILASIAEAANYSSASAFTLDFNERTGMPPGAYRKANNPNIAEPDFECGLKLLTTTTLPISKVAEQAGYGSTPTFSNLVKDKTGCTPGQYREENFSISDVGLGHP